MEFSINKGRGYVSAEENRAEHNELSTIAIDSIYTPIRNVKYAVENFRVEQKTDYEKLREAAQILISHFSLFAENKIAIEYVDIVDTDEFDEDSLHMRQLLKSKLSGLDLSVRALNCLNAAGVDTLGDLVSLSRSDLMKIRNFGKKSLTELDELLATLNLSFGMDISKYKLDKD